MKNNIRSSRFMHIQAYSGIIKHIQTYPDMIRHIRAYPEIIQAYSELWYILNHDIFKTRGIFKALVYP